MHRRTRRTWPCSVPMCGTTVATMPAVAAPEVAQGVDPGQQEAKGGRRRKGNGKGKSQPQQPGWGQQPYVGAYGTPATAPNLQGQGLVQGPPFGAQRGREHGPRHEAVFES